MSKAYVLLSGGIDSSTCLAIALRAHGSATGVGINYGQRHQKELDHAQLVAIALGADSITKVIRGVISKGGLTDDDLKIPTVSYSQLPHGVSPTYVPFRNGTLLSVVAGMASIDDEAEAVYYGAHAEDAENWAYPDCTPEFITAMKTAIRIGTYNKIKLEAPLMRMKKSEVVLAGEDLRVPWELTWSCYEGGRYHCGVCPTCRARRDAFVDAGVIDPTTYIANPEEVT